jgi:hypothetical protein
MLLALPFLALVFGVSNQISQEATVKEFGYKLHIFIKFLLTFIFTYIVNIIYKLFTLGTADLSRVFFDFHIVFTLEAVIFLTLFLAVHITCVVLFNKILKKSAIYLLNILLKISMVFILIIEILKGNLFFSFEIILATSLFLLGVSFVLNVFNNKKISVKQGRVTIIILVFLVIFNVAYPYQQQHLLNANYINKETMIMLSAFLTSLYGLLFLRPNLDRLKESLSPYTIQAMAHVISQFALLELLENCMTTYMFVMGLMGIGLTIFSSIILKQKINKYQYLGVLLAMAGFVYMQILLNV